MIKKVTLFFLPVSFSLTSCMVDLKILPSETGTSVFSIQSPTWIPDLDKTPPISWNFENIFSSMTMQIALGHSPGDSNILGWTEVTSNNWSASTLTLPDNQKVFPTIRVIDKRGHVRALESGKGWVPSTDGAGAYETYQTLPVTSGSRHVASEDLNNDGYPDLVSADGGDGFYNISVFLTNPDGTYKTPVTYTVTNNPQMVFIKDMNGDAIWDIIAATYSGSVHILKGDGTGAFAPHDVLTLGTSLTAIDLVDINNDGSLDLTIARDVGANRVDVYLNNGDGEFSWASSPHKIVAIPTRPKCVVVGDFNKDGEIDYAVTSYQSTVFRIVWGGALPQQDLTVGTESLGLAAADLNNDGYLDLVTAETSLNKIHIYWGSSTTVTTTPTVLDSPGRPHGIFIADVNKDGHLDIVSSSNTTNTADPSFGTLGIHLGDSQGGFTPKFEIPVQGSSYRPLVKDLNLDGRPDLIVGTGAVLSYVIAK